MQATRIIAVRHGETAWTWTPEGFTLVGWADSGHLDNLSQDETST